MRYAVVIEKAKKNYSAYVPDVPGCIATGKTVQETLNHLREALEFHFEGMCEDGDRIPDPKTLVDYIDVVVQRIQGRTSSTHSSPSRLRGRPSSSGESREFTAGVMVSPTPTPD